MTLILRRALLTGALGLAALLPGCAQPAPPGVGTPGIDLSTPLATLAPLPPTATPVPLPPTAPPPSATAGPATASPLPFASPSPVVVPTADVALPQVTFNTAAGAAITLYVEIADTPEKQETGLMNRTAMAEDQGMLFAFEGQTTVPFWMKDTLLPLSIAFVADTGRIVDLQDMQPRDLTLHTPAAPYTYAIEVNQGYFRRHAIAVGDHVTLPVLPTATPVRFATPPVAPP
jgi:uncharacterized protein